MIKVVGVELLTVFFTVLFVSVGPVVTSLTLVVRVHSLFLSFAWLASVVLFQGTAFGCWLFPIDPFRVFSAVVTALVLPWSVEKWSLTAGLPPDGSAPSGAEVRERCGPVCSACGGGGSVLLPRRQGEDSCVAKPTAQTGWAAHSPPPGWVP